ncbi:hypothetical protein JOC73_001628 [Alkaliphilus hydrothermalis]|uniref:Uncharacterized protein n=1 Tax=Alkaliphilus hydrothermalis TaxID=1482730 RepID=A0ABS2NQE5_9FIRM|nr:hypothetical protein [Alkaliphilus hydrothermalis]
MLRICSDAEDEGFSTTQPVQKLSDSRNKSNQRL